MPPTPTHQSTEIVPTPATGKPRDQDQPALSASGLRRSYGSVEAVRGIDLEISRGEIFALLGPNGAGKTTTLEIFEGFRERSAGDVQVLGSDPQQAGRTWRERIGIVLQDSFPEPELTVRECLTLYAGFYKHPRRVEETLGQVGLGELAVRRCEQLSGGERRRLDVALALIGDPELLFLDEPTTGFDPAARRAMWELVHSLRSSGTTVVLTTHYMEEAERLADRIAVIARGEIVATGTPASLRSRSWLAAEITFTVPGGIALTSLPVGVGVPSIPADRKVRVSSEDPLETLFSLTRWAIAHGHELPDLELRRPTLEDVYLDLTASTAEGGSQR